MRKSRSPRRRAHFEFTGKSSFPEIELSPQRRAYFCKSSFHASRSALQNSCSRPDAVHIMNSLGIQPFQKSSSRLDAVHISVSRHFTFPDRLFENHSRLDAVHILGSLGALLGALGPISGSVGAVLGHLGAVHRHFISQESLCENRAIASTPCIFL